MNNQGHKSKRIKLTRPNTQRLAVRPEPKPKPAPISFCSVEGCPQKEDGFSSRLQWYDHMEKNHTPWPDGRYHCPFEHCKCHKSGFNYKIHYQDHMGWHIVHKHMLGEGDKDEVPLPREIMDEQRDFQDEIDDAADEDLEDSQVQIASASSRRIDGRGASRFGPGVYWED